MYKCTCRPLLAKVDVVHCRGVKINKQWKHTWVFIDWHSCSQVYFPTICTSFSVSQVTCTLFNTHDYCMSRQILKFQSYKWEQIFNFPTKFSWKILRYVQPTDLASCNGMYNSHQYYIKGNQWIFWSLVLYIKVSHFSWEFVEENLLKRISDLVLM